MLLPCLPSPCFSLRAALFADDANSTNDKPAAKSGGSAKNSDAKSGDAKAASNKSGETKDETSATTGESSSSSGGGAGGEAKSKYAPFTTVTKEHKQVSGLVTLWHKEGSVLAEFSPHTLNRDFIVVISIARGISYGLAKSLNGNHRSRLAQLGRSPSTCC